MVDIQSGSSTLEAIIRFRYETDELFNAVSMRTLLRAKDVVVQDESGTVKSMVNKWAITENERATFLKSLERAIYDLYPEVIKMTVGIDNSEFVDETIAPLAGGDDLSGKWSGFQIVNHEAYNENVVNLVDKKINSVLVYLIMVDWYTMIGVDGEVAKNMALKDREMIALSDALFDLRKPLLS